MSIQTNSRPALHFSTRDLLIMAVLAALGGVASTYINTLGDAIHAALGLPGATQWAAGLHVIWIVLSAGILRKPGTGTVTGILKGAVELMSGSTHGIIILLVNLVAGLLVDFGFLLFRQKRNLPTYLIAGGLATGSNVLVFQIFATLPLNMLGLSAIVLLLLVAFISGLIFAGVIPYLLVNTLTKAGVIKVPEKPLEKNKIGWFILLGVFILTVLLAIFLQANLQGPQSINIEGAVETPLIFSSNSTSIDRVTRQMDYRGVMTEYQGFPLDEIITAAQPDVNADTLLIEASDGYSFLISFEELQANDNILLVKTGQGQNVSFDIVGPESSKAWVRNITTITVIAAESLEIKDMEGRIHYFNPEEWIAQMDSTQVALPGGNQKLQGVPIWNILSQHLDGHQPTNVIVASDTDAVTISWTEIEDNDDLRLFTVINPSGIEFALAEMSGEVRLYPVRSIEVQK